MQCPLCGGPCLKPNADQQDLIKKIINKSVQSEPVWRHPVPKSPGVAERLKVDQGQPVLRTAYGQPVVVQEQPMMASLPVATVTTAELFDWLECLVAIRQDEPPFFGRYDSYGRIEKGKEQIDVYQNDSSAVGLHVRCWELLGKPDFDWLIEHRISGGDLAIEPFKDCLDQFFDWEHLIEKEDSWAVSDPSFHQGQKNSERISEIINRINNIYK